MTEARNIRPSLESDLPVSKAAVIRALRAAGNPVRPATIDWLYATGKLRGYAANPASNSPSPRVKFVPAEVVEALRQLVVKPRSAREASEDERVVANALRSR